MIVLIVLLWVLMQMQNAPTWTYVLVILGMVIQVVDMVVKVVEKILKDKQIKEFEKLQKQMMKQTIAKQMGGNDAESED